MNHIETLKKMLKPAIAFEQHEEIAALTAAIDLIERLHAVEIWASETTPMLIKEDDWTIETDDGVIHGKTLCEAIDAALNAHHGKEEM